jgi:predicted MFS family arabinose efflux permease
VPLVLPLGALVISRTLVPETPRAGGRRPDVAGAAVLFVTLAALSAGLILGPVPGAAPMPLFAFATAAIAGAAFLVIERRVADPMLPLSFFKRRTFLGGNVVWMLGALTSWGMVFFLAITLQATLGLRPFAAGLVLAPIYLVMMAGSPLAGRVAERIGPRPPILVGLGLYAGGLWLLSWIGPSSTVIPDVLVGVGVTAVGMATFSAPLAAVTLGSLDDADQGLASGVNNAMGQFGGLLAIDVLPAMAGLAGVNFGDPAFAAGYASALRAAAGLAGIGIVVTVLTLGETRSRLESSTRRSGSIAQSA